MRHSSVIDAAGAIYVLGGSYSTSVASGSTYLKDVWASIAKVGFCRMPASYLPVAGSRPRKGPYNCLKWPKIRL